MTAKTAALVIGIVFIVVGILGFIPNPIVSPDGIFATDTMAGAYGFGASLAVKIVGIVYAIVAILGFFVVGEDGVMLGLIHVNEADKWLHVVLAIVILIAGFTLPDDKMA